MLHSSSVATGPLSGATPVKPEREPFYSGNNSCSIIFIGPMSFLWPSQHCPCTLNICIT